MSYKSHKDDDVDKKIPVDEEPKSPGTCDDKFFVNDPFSKQ